MFVIHGSSRTNAYLSCFFSSSVLHEQMFEFPDEGYTEVHLRPDKALRRARQIFSALLRKERNAAVTGAPEAPRAAAAGGD